MSATTEKIVADRVIFLNGSIPPSGRNRFLQGRRAGQAPCSPRPPYQPLCRGYGTVRRSCRVRPRLSRGSFLVGVEALVILPH